ncbi:MAG: SDR family NAD(P)-dependent oxidoreductase [Parachlamydiaceae bacterium]
MELGIKGKTALVTGSTLGIGKAIAETLRKEGAHVIINGRNEKRVSEFAIEIGAQGITADLSTPEGAEKIIREIGNQKIDILINNAGYFEVKSLEELTDQDWYNMFELNVMSGVRLTKALFPKMLKENWGRVIFIASEQSVKPHPQMLHYAMSKAANASIARGLAESTKGTQVTVNSVLVGPTWSEGVDSFMGNNATREGLSLEDSRRLFFATEASSSLIQRHLTTQEVADQVVFLVSSNASGINGAAQRVDGGIVRTML